MRHKGSLRLGLVGRFALVSLIPIVVLGIALSHVLRAEIRARALSNARADASLLERTIVQSRLTPNQLRNGLDPAQVRELDRSLHASLQGGEIARIKVWDPQGHVVYSNNPSIIGKRFELDEDLRAALGGDVHSDVSNLKDAENAGDRRFGQLLEVYTPLRFGAKAPVSGAFELYLPYLPVKAAIAHDTHRLSVVLIGGLALLYLALFRIVSGASSRLRRQADENERLANYDTLTGLPNRRAFRARGQAAVAAAAETGHGVALILLDLNRFKEINDTLGHENGDQVLTELAKRLRLSVDEDAVVSRLGGDEFGVLLSSVSDADDALQVAESLRGALKEPFVLDEITLDLDGSVGVAIYPDHGEQIDVLVQRADVALYVAKEHHTGCELYSPLRDDYSPERLALVGELRRGLDRRELVVYYQPIAELSTGHVSRVEALVRWQHPTRGLIKPDEFVPLAERTGMIRDLTLAVLDEALLQLRAWRSAGLDLTVGVNLSGRDVIDVQLPEKVHLLLTKHDVPPDRLTFELTESVILTDPLRARAVLSRLDAMGVSLAIDDFGSGYSSLGYLKRLPVSELKIDRSFVLNMERDANDAVIVRSTVELGRNLGLRVVAEGVETEESWQALSGFGCDDAQGYLLTKPLPGADLAQWLRLRPVGAAGLRAPAA
jgi:diguanylate cyclase (GGDEF)-like protein